MRLHRTTLGVFVEQHGQFFSVQAHNWDELLCDGALPERLQSAISAAANPRSMAPLCFRLSKARTSGQQALRIIGAAMRA